MAYGCRYGPETYANAVSGAHKYRYTVGKGGTKFRGNLHSDQILPANSRVGARRDAKFRVSTRAAMPVDQSLPNPDRIIRPAAQFVRRLFAVRVGQAEDE